jgi:hypothetical protein
MNIEKMREEFEAAYMRDLVGSSAEDASLWLERGSDGEYRSFQARGSWWGFKVSRESLVIELPKPYSEHRLVSKPERHARSSTLCEVREAIEAAGLKVNS